MTSKRAIETPTVLVPEGPFAMGDATGRDDERPVHTVRLSAFRIGVCPVTNREFATFLGATGHEPPRFWDEPRFAVRGQPVVGVNWWDAVAYCDWLSRATGRHYRLPTEAEREKAARGGLDRARYPWGDDPGEGGGQFMQDAPYPVGLSTANGYGLHDMGYNVHEWCSDWYDPTYYAASPDRDPQGPPSGTRRASRGGAWRHQIKVSRCAARSSLDPSFRYNDYGFRIAEAVEGRPTS